MDNSFAKIYLDKKLSFHCEEDTTETIYGFSVRRKKKTITLKWCMESRLLKYMCFDENIMLFYFLWESEGEGKRSILTIKLLKGCIHFNFDDQLFVFSNENEYAMYSFIMTIIVAWIKQYKSDGSISHDTKIHCTRIDRFINDRIAKIKMLRSLTSDATSYFSSFDALVFQCTRKYVGREICFDK
jgi:hypothetical protein